MGNSIDMVKIEIGGKLYDVVSLENYISNTDAYIPNQTAIRSGNYALPVIMSTDVDKRPGIVAGKGKVFCKRCDPLEEEKEYYCLDRAIDFSDSKNIGELLAKQEAVRDIEYEILTTVDRIFKPHIGQNDSPAIKALKQAVIEKEIDLDKYEPRFNGNYPNDKRLLSKDKISMPMLQRMCDALDIKAVLTLFDKNPDVPNPIGRTIQVELTGGNEEDDD